MGMHERAIALLLEQNFVPGITVKVGYFLNNGYHKDGVWSVEKEGAYRLWGSQLAKEGWTIQEIRELLNNPDAEANFLREEYLRALLEVA